MIHGWSLSNPKHWVSSFLVKINILLLFRGPTNSAAPMSMCLKINEIFSPDSGNMQSTPIAIITHFSGHFYNKGKDFGPQGYRSDDGTFKPGRYGRKRKYS